MCVDGREIDTKSVVVVRYGATAGFVGRGYSGILANNLFEVVPDESVISKDFLYLPSNMGLLNVIYMKRHSAQQCQPYLSL